MKISKYIKFALIEIITTLLILSILLPNHITTTAFSVSNSEKISSKNSNKSKSLTNIQSKITLKNNFKSEITKNNLKATFSNKNKATTKSMSLTNFKNYLSKIKLNKQIDFMLAFNNLEKDSMKKYNQEIKLDYSEINSKNSKKSNNYKFKTKEEKEFEQSNNSNESLFSSLNKSTNKLKNKSYKKSVLSLKEEMKKVETIQISNEEKFQKFNTTDVIEDWYLIASLEFDNYSKFPPIKLPIGVTVTIKRDENYFRLNPAYNCTDPAKPPTERHFYFRINQNHIYYSATSKDMNVLGVIEVERATEVTKIIDDSYAKEIYCFVIVDKSGSEWKICNCDKNKTIKPYCFLKFIMKDYSDSICHSNPGCPVVEKKIIQPIIIIPIPSPQCNENWTFRKYGDDWECGCSEGTEQSPIDLPEVKDAIDSPIKPLFYYKEVNKIADETTLDKKIVKGNHIEIKYFENKLNLLHYDFGKIVTLDGAVYRAEEITFHTPSQHTINGEQFDMEMSVIHYGISKGDIGKQAVVSFLFKQTPGAYNLFFESIDFFNLPNPIETAKSVLENIYLPKILYSVEEKEDFIGASGMECFSFYTYQGSIMFPPCTERTIMYVSSKPIPLSTTVIQLFKEALQTPDLIHKANGEVFSDNSGFLYNNRSTKARNGRPVFHYDCGSSCFKKPKKPDPKPTGHYEKLNKKLTQYFYVNGETPSGLPGAFVVSEKEAKFGTGEN